jgi:hypothetical protein
VADGIELEQPAADVQRLLLGRQTRCAVGEVEAGTGEDPRQFLYILLGVCRAARPAAHAERVQLHQLARVVFIDPVAGALRVVEILEHRGRQRGREDKVGEAPQGVRTYRLLFVLGDRPAHVGLLGEDAEVIHPEPRHLLAQLRRRAQGPQQVPFRGLVDGLVPGLVQRHPGHLLRRFIRKSIDALLLRAHRLRVRCGALAGDGNRRNRRCKIGWVGRRRVELRVEELLPTQPPVFGGGAAVDPEGDAPEPAQLAPGQRRRRRGSKRARQAQQ